MTDPQKNPTPAMWLRDLQAIFAMDPKSYEKTEERNYAAYPDSEWAKEYAYSLWNGFCYVMANLPYWEEEWLAVVGKGGLVKDCLLASVYWDVLQAPLASMHLLNFDKKAIADRAREILKRFLDEEPQPEAHSEPTK